MVSLCQILFRKSDNQENYLLFIINIVVGRDNIKSNG